MSQLDNMKILLDIDTDDSSQDTRLQLELDYAASFITDIRNSWDLTDPDNPVVSVENKYLGTQVELAIQSYSKRGAEGESSHNEAGVSRSYSNGGLYSTATVNQIIPRVRVITDVIEDVEEE